MFQIWSDKILTTAFCLQRGMTKVANHIFHANSIQIFRISNNKTEHVCLIVLFSFPLKNARTSLCCFDQYT